MTEEMVLSIWDLVEACMQTSMSRGQHDDALREQIRE